MNRKNQQGYAAVIAIMVVIFAAIAVGVSAYFSAYNYGNRTEKRMEAMLEDNENVYAQGSQKIIEMAQVPDMYADKVREVATAAISGRMGPEGARATFLVLKEQNPNISDAMFVRVQDTIVEFRNKFERVQREMVDVKRGYREALDSPWRGFWLQAAGYPKIDMKKFDIVSTSKARKTFETKIDDGIKLRPEK